MAGNDDAVGIDAQYGGVTGQIAQPVQTVGDGIVHAHPAARHPIVGADAKPRRRGASTEGAEKQSIASREQVFQPPPEIQ